MYHELTNNATEKYPFLIEHINVKYIPHFHTETELVYVLEGEVEVTVEDSSFSLKKGEICIFTPEQIHNLYSGKYSRVFVMKLFSAYDLCDIRLKKSILRQGDANYDAFASIIREIMRENSEKKAGYELSVNICSQKILLSIIREMEHVHLENKTKIKRESRNSFLCGVADFLEKNYAEEFSLEDAAGYFNFSKSYFCHYFKNVTGVTFWRYFTIFRLEKSVEIIKESPDKTFAEVAGEAGFNNIRSFNQAFKEYYNSTPREYVKKYFDFY